MKYELASQIQIGDYVTIPATKALPQLSGRVEQIANFGHTGYHAVKVYCSGYGSITLNYRDLEFVCRERKNTELKYIKGKYLLCQYLGVFRLDNSKYYKVWKSNSSNELHSYVRVEEVFQHFGLWQTAGKRAKFIYDAGSHMFNQRAFSEKE